MTVAATGYSGFRRKDLASRFVVLIVVLAFALQSYIAQTHIHVVSQGFDGVTKIAGTKLPAQDKTPIDDSQRGCPLCQAVAYSGVFVAPTALILRQPFVWFETLPSAFSARIASGAAAHGWQSRAPPPL